MEQPPEQYLTVEEVAARYRKTPATIRHWRREGYGPRGSKVGRSVLYAESECRRFDDELRQQREAATPVAI